MRFRCASVATTPIVPWPHMLRYPTLLKKITPIRSDWEGERAREPCSSSKAPTITSDPRGSFTIADRNRSCSSRNRFRRSEIGPLPRSGPPLITTRVGSPAVCESMTSMRRISRLGKFRPVLNPVMNDLQDRFPFVTGERQARRAHPLRAETTFLHRQLDVLHKLHMRIQMQQRREPTVNRQRVLVAPSAP